ncbi:DMT family transporter [Pseudodesulfovibrio sp.]|uniref:DMT family transporter n=1 Tax=Pseudodesulfovibrio sp. TaxID=2035812 RepID=UPI0026150950|nr:DMT family transporter [Pseudodesulfovibrio sp.]MDD3313548.1 DMT family transporter [Pseudodesulfovibrio sp.]
MNNRALRADILLFVTAAIWGFAFVAQRVGMDHVGPLTFNGIRFALGGLALIPLALRLEKNRAATYTPAGARRIGLGGIALGVVLFFGASLQQAGLAGPQLAVFGLDASTAGKAGFITGLYVVLVPICGLFLRERPGWGTWLGAVIAVVGMYLLSVTADLSVAFGDLLVLVSALFWTTHVLLVGKISPGMDAADAVKLSIVQFLACAALSLVVAFPTEPVAMGSILDAGIPILYGGFMSVGIAYTLQIVAQRDAPSAHAAIIMSLEAVFAAIGGCVMLDETLTVRALIGCGLMLAGMVLSQLKP